MFCLYILNSCLCSLILQFVGSWEKLPSYGVKVTEAQGTKVGSRLMITGGFINGIDDATPENYYLDLDNPMSNWIKLPNMPKPTGSDANGNEGTTHSPPVGIGGNVYIQAGGLVGGARPDHVPINDVYKFDFDTMKWSKLPDLPMTLFGGGMVYDEGRNQLIHSMGAYTGKFADSYDTFVLDLDDIAAGWTEKTPAPFSGNHAAAVTAEDGNGNKRHFFMGGQMGGNESQGNTKHLMEYDVTTDSWITHADMPIARGHASWSADAISCGFILAGGTINATPRTRTTDISFYDISTDQWTESIGQLPGNAASPICEFYKDYLYCIPVSSGNTGYRIKVVVPE